MIVPLLQPEPEQYTITIPENCEPGQIISARITNTKTVDVKIPEGAKAGENFTFVVSRSTVPVAIPIEDHRFFNAKCLNRSGIFFVIFMCVVLITSIASLFVTALLPIAAVTPPILIMEMMRRLYKQHVTRCQMTISFFECVLWMTLLFFILFGLGQIPVYPFQIPSHEKDGSCIKCIGGYAFTSYFTAGTLEEITKFLAIRRILYSDQVQNPRALWVYSVCAGAGFAAVENILYVIGGGGMVAIMRALLSIPLHCSTGFVMGLVMGKSRFSCKNRKNLNYFWILFPPIFIHGTYDFAIFTGSGIGGATSALIILSFVCLVSTLVWIRWEVTKQEERFPLIGESTENIHSLIESGEVLRPFPCCELCVCCYSE